MEEDGRSCTAQSISLLLSDLASQHEQLEQVRRDFSSALMAAQSTAGHARQLLRETAPAQPTAGHAREVFRGTPPRPQTPPLEESGQGVPRGTAPWPPTLPLGERVREEGAAAEEEVEDERPVPSEWHLRVSKSSTLPATKPFEKELKEALGDGLASMAGSCEWQGEVRELGSLITEAAADGDDGDLAFLPSPRLNSVMQTVAYHSRRPSLASSDGEGVGSEETCCWDESMNIVRFQAIKRLTERLGKKTLRGNVSSQQVYRAMDDLGIHMYTLGRIDTWLAQVRSIYREFQEVKKQPSIHRRSWRISRGSSSTLDADSDVSDLEQDSSVQKMRFRTFVEAILDDEMLSGLRSDFRTMSIAIRESLFSGRANGLVAQITRTRVEDVVAPMPRPDLVTRIEPFVAFLIVLNGIFIGIQTSKLDRQDIDGWFWGNVVFTLFMGMEVVLRIAIVGSRALFRGDDHWWNMFDVVVFTTSVCDIAVEAIYDDSHLMPFSLIRIMRLTRMTRLVRLFRLRMLKELNLMIRGLLGGLRTLFWAIVLLFFMLYVIGVLTTTMIGPAYKMPSDVVRDELFNSVPRSVLTSFRCFMGDCTTSMGKPIIKIMSDSYGPLFVMGYMGSTVFIVFGLFNLIIAVYVENTMVHAKTDGIKSSQERDLDAVRFAKHTAKLLKKFCAAEKLWSSRFDGHPGKREVMKAMRASVIDDAAEASMEVSKELYLVVIQDPSVQKIMDEMDLPPEREHLFDVLDADCSGGLEVPELIAGLLRLRGEAKRSDIVGALLGVRAIQTMIRDQDQRLVELQDHIEQLGSPEQAIVGLVQQKSLAASTSGSGLLSSNSGGPVPSERRLSMTKVRSSYRRAPARSFR